MSAKPPVSEGTFIVGPTQGSKQARHQSLRNKGPEKETGAFAPVTVYCLLRSLSAYTLPSFSSSAECVRVSRVRFGGRSRQTTTKMQNTRRPAAADSEESITNQSYVQHVQQSVFHLDANNRQIARCFSSPVQMSDANYNVYAEIEERKETGGTSLYIDIAVTTGHPDTPPEAPSHYGDYSRPAVLPGAGHAGHVSGDLT